MNEIYTTCYWLLLSAVNLAAGAAVADCSLVRSWRVLLTSVHSKEGPHFSENPLWRCDHAELPDATCKHDHSKGPNLFVTNKHAPIC